MVEIVGVRVERLSIPQGSVLVDRRVDEDWEIHLLLVNHDQRLGDSLTLMGLQIAEHISL